MKKLMFMLIIASMLFVVPQAMAYQKGDLEATLGGSGSSDESFDGTVFNVEGALGFFLTDNLETVWRQGISYADVRGSNNNWNGSTRLAFDYNFDFAPIFPYLGVNFGYLYGDTVKEQFIAGPEAGLKFFVNSTTFITAGLEYEVLSKDAEDLNDNFDDGRFVYLLGIGFTF